MEVGTGKLVKSLLQPIDHVDLSYHVQAMRVHLHVGQEEGQFYLILAYLLFLTQPEAILHCDFARMQVVHVEFFPVAQDFHCSQEVYLVFVHA